MRRRRRAGWLSVVLPFGVVPRVQPRVFAQASCCLARNVETIHLIQCVCACVVQLLFMISRNCHSSVIVVLKKCWTFHLKIVDDILISVVVDISYWNISVGVLSVSCGDYGRTLHDTFKTSFLVSFFSGFLVPNAQLSKRHVFP